MGTLQAAVAELKCPHVTSCSQLPGSAGARPTLLSCISFAIKSKSAQNMVGLKTQSLLLIKSTDGSSHFQVYKHMMNLSDKHLLMEMQSCQTLTPVMAAHTAANGRLRV